MLGRFRRLLCLLYFAVAGVAAAQGISYTVQVVALSDKAAALELQTQLNAQGFPAYVVRSTTADGDVYRLRVGAFANRQAALVFAEAMPQVAGGRPVPALAEAIPPGIVSLAPRLLTRIIPEARELAVAPWPGGLAVRLQQRSPLSEARYVLLLGAEMSSFDAWLAVPGEDGDRTQVRNLPLWPDSYETDPPEAREAYRSSVLSLVAETLSLPLNDVIATEFHANNEERPSLVVVERVRPTAQDGGTLTALGVPELGLSPTGPVQYLALDAADVPQAPETTVVSSLTPTTDAVQGDGWSAWSDGAFLRISLDGGSTWRAGVGVPLWTDGTVLITVQDGSYFFYDFVER